MMVFTNSCFSGDLQGSDGRTGDLESGDGSAAIGELHSSIRVADNYGCEIEGWGKETFPSLKKQVKTSDYYVLCLILKKH